MLDLKPVAPKPLRTHTSDRTMPITPSQGEQVLVSQIFGKIYLERPRVLTKDAARRVFGGANLPPVVISEILTLADENRDGKLSQNEVAIAVRLLGWAQAGSRVTRLLISQRGCAPLLLSSSYN
jgi:epidermal growth factor receptor substrate 15